MGFGAHRAENHGPGCHHQGCSAHPHSRAHPITGRWLPTPPFPAAAQHLEKLAG